MAVFQFDTRLKAPPPTATEAPLPAPVTPAARAFLSFAEHCTECAAPACYATCDLFDPTPAGKCRRFDHGIQPLRSGSRVLADVRFRKWGKLEARGSVAPLPARRITILESALAHAALWMARIGAFLSRMLGARWHRLEDHLHERLRRRLGQGRQAPLPNSFRAEIVNPGTAPVKLQLAIVIDQERVGGIIALEDQPHPFRQSITAAPGYNCIKVPGGAFAPVAASGLPFLVQITIDGDEGAHLMFGALDFVWDAPAPPAPTDPDAPFRPPAKCVVFDLDNTIWDGVLLEGPVTVQPGIADLFRQLDARGVLLSVASKNARADAMARLEAAGLADYLLHPQISWAPKSEGLAAIAASLNIGTDSLLFVDDNPFERAEVAAALPMVEVLPHSDLHDLADHPRLRGSVTEESRNRREMYRAASARTHAGAAYADYRA
ncbi:HAD-IIIC family phosphatase, partial [Tsuneonella aeria]